MERSDLRRRSSSARHLEAVCAHLGRHKPGASKRCKRRAQQCTLSMSNSFESTVVVVGVCGGAHVHSHEAATRIQGVSTCGHSRGLMRRAGHPRFHRMPATPTPPPPTLLNLIHLPITNGIVCSYTPSDISATDSLFHIGPGVLILDASVPVYCNASV